MYFVLDGVVYGYRSHYFFALQNRRQLSTSCSSLSNDNGNDVAPNLKRKVKAKRPTLGHVVPKDARRKCTL